MSHPIGNCELCGRRIIVPPTHVSLCDMCTADVVPQDTAKTLREWRRERARNARDRRTAVSL